MFCVTTENIVTRWLHDIVVPYPVAYLLRSYIYVLWACCVAAISSLTCSNHWLQVIVLRLLHADQVRLLEIFHRRYTFKSSRTLLLGVKNRFLMCWEVLPCFVCAEIDCLLCYELFRILTCFIISPFKCRYATFHYRNVLITYLFIIYFLPHRILFSLGNTDSLLTKLYE
jgi:hypothetical protein